MNTKKSVIIIVLAILIALGLFFFLNQRNKQSKQVENETGKVVKTNVDFDKAPKGFPEGVPIEAGAKLTQNYNATSPDGRFQATRVFETAKTLDENLAIYSDYLKKQGWVVGSTLNDPTYKVISGTKGLQNMQIVIDENKVNKIKTVSITYSESN